MRANPSDDRNRLIGWDIVRAWAAVGVVALHACVPYADPGMPGLAWSTSDIGPRGFATTAITAVMWSIEIVIMPLFLVMAGFLANASMNRRGVGSTLRSRVRRLGVPLVLAGLLLLPIDLYVWLTGWLADGLIEARKLRSLKFNSDFDAHLWGSAHLWFLQYLITYVAVLAVVKTMVSRSRAATSLAANIIGRPAMGAIALGSAGVVTIATAPEVIWGFQHSFWPVPSKWFYSGLFFVAGVGLNEVDEKLRGLSAIAPRMIVPSVMLVVAAVVLGMWQLRNGGNATTTLALALLSVGAATSVTFAVLGAAARRRSHIHWVMRSLASASFGIYILHHPIVGLTQISIKHLGVEISTLIKCVLTIAIGVCVPWLMQSLAAGNFRRRVSNHAPPIALPFPVRGGDEPDADASFHRKAG